nr:MAG TPA: hypothetical protein [Caudoviricetes sp.]
MLNVELSALPILNYSILNFIINKLNFIELWQINFQRVRLQH